MAGAVRVMAVLVTTLLAVSAVSGSRIPTVFMAPAPAPAIKMTADLLFTLSAAKATFTASDRLALEGLQSTAQAFNIDTRTTGIYTLGTFANTTAGAPFAAAWAGAPDALMYASRAGSTTSALLRLSHPVFDAAAGRLTFVVRLLTADVAQLSLAGGATARAADDVANGISTALLTEVPVGAELTSVALFIDEASIKIGSVATAKQGWGCGGWSGCGGQWSNSDWNAWGQSGQQNTNINNNNVQSNVGYNQPTTNVNNNNVVNNQGWNQSPTNINNNNVAGNGGPANLNNNNVGGGTNINNNNVGGGR